MYSANHSGIRVSVGMCGRRDVILEAFLDRGSLPLKANNSYVDELLQNH